MTSTWKKGYKDGSFRGIQFFISGHNYSGGRRLATHEFPERDDVTYEDLGRKQRTFNLTAYIIGDNYFQHREELISALENESEPGKLVHPYRGIFQVKCDNFSLRETTGEGRVARFDMVFKEDLDLGLVQVFPNAQTSALSAKQSLLDAVLDWLENAYDIVSAPVRFLDDVNDTIGEAFDVIDALKKLANTQAEFNNAIDNLKGRVIALTLNATLLANSFKELVQFGTDPTSSLLFGPTADNAKEQTQELYRLSEFADSPVVDTPVEISQDPDYPAFQVQQVVKYNCVAGLIGLITVEEFGAQEDAESAKVKLFDLIDEISATTFVTDDIYESLRDAKAAINADIENRLVNLPRLVDFELPETRNVLLVANEIYGELDNVEDIIERNKIFHPGFISSAEPIQVKVND